MPKIVDRDARRATVIAAVWDVIIEQGVGQASLAAVAERAGLAIGSVRHFFGSHSDLLAAAAQAAVDAITERLLVHRDLITNSADRLASTETALAELLPLDTRRRQESTVWFAFAAAARTDPALAQLALTVHRGTRTLIRRVLDHTRFAGDEVEVERLAGLIDGLAMSGVLQPDQLPAGLARAVLRRHLQALAGGR